ncbi:MAG: hypothetical protein JNJ83_18490 [Verrucomicrobiaceae bacterium]|nr:hypothetical protein [Verrucomicrobiaceae bacterium]
MPRYLLVAGVDFGTSFTKVVLRDNNTPGSNAVVVPFPGHADGLLPSLIGIAHDCLTPPTALGESAKVPYLKMLAAHVANGEALDATHVKIPAALDALRRSRTDAVVATELLAFYFAHVMAATEDFIRSKSPWRDFDFTPDNTNDFLIYQLAVPTGLLADDGATERLFRDAFIAAHELRRGMDATMQKSTPQQPWSEKVAQVFACGRATLEARFEWQCLLYPEVAAAVQTVFRAPNARDGLYITMDVGAGTVDLNAFLRFRSNATRRLDYYSAIICPLGVQNLNDPHSAVKQRVENELMEELRMDLHALYRRALIHQPNHGVPGTGTRTWDRASLFIFGGGSHHNGYRQNFSAGLDHAGIHEPQVLNLPAAQDLTRPPNVEFGRFAVAYGISFFRPSLDQVRLPHELTPFRELYPEPTDEPPRQYGFNWDD